MPRILVVDDEALVRATFRAALEKAGHDVLEAADGEECLRFCGATEPDLVLLDVLMPGKDGVETIRELRRRGSTVPVLAVSGGGGLDGGTGLLLRTVELLGADGVRGKPLRNGDLLVAVDECLAARAARPLSHAPLTSR